MKKVSVLALISAISFLSCKDDKVDPTNPAVPKLELVVKPYFGNQVIGENTIISTAEGYDVEFTELKFFATNLKNGSNTLTDAALYDWKVKGTTMFTVPGDKNNFGSLTGNLGVGADQNHLDPSAFPNDNPLNIAISGDMHWDWNPGYIFVKVEAKVDTIPDGNALFDHNVVFHVGKDEFLQSLSFTDLSWQEVDENLSRATLKLDMQKFLQNDGQNINLKTEFSVHTAPGQEALAGKIIQNFKAALSKL